ncbi:glycyl-tRNA synthetase, beta subunit [Denitrovibrio acetiphilus DSM 12809]|uniref:Glycine--tRNA ligase beta subunit n=1 Tax=Denitrovibrio acetiphilus (strain DSM 12809 / NBRC 114555 / N2460) TaxID=522772 RepID=D4H5X2_DENA2|nr:glycine--tRNA ligase subunit beta [Denitrovibrio acetiphilus]ADD69563.1 glycyl-tRNA synthetase, beta subunit [Denitrovibrio acetiphilus DSM 12809]
MPDFLLEIGSEEIPAGFIGSACEYLKNDFTKRFTDAGIGFNDIESDGTPRRFYVSIKGLAEKQEDREDTIMGPPAAVAFDADGNLTKAGLGFVKSKGLSEDSLTKAETERGIYLSGVKKTKGVPTRDFIEGILIDVIKSIPFRKSMHWGDKTFRYARPVHWFLALFGGDVISFDIDGIKSGNKTMGHRIHANEYFEVKDFDDYKAKLKEARVISSTEERISQVREQVAEIEKETGYKVDLDEDLLETVAGLVEYPVALMGEFEERYLDIPAEVLITSMKNHQKYFYVTDKDGNLVNKFIGVSNTVPNDPQLVKTGYARVLRARLADAEFFWANDRKYPLENRVEELKKVVYQEKIGTSYEKMERFRKLAVFFSENLNPSAKTDTERAATLCKADLLSEMVYEFPELQGIMGHRYAKLQGENDVVAQAIEEHYLPRFAGDDLPESDTGAFISMADKLDTICGCFAINLIPTGNQDPYALRRGAIGILSTIKAKGYRIGLKEMIGESADLLSGYISFDKEKTVELVYDFIIQRYRQILAGEGIPADCVEAACEISDDIITIEAAAKALSESKQTKEFASIAAGYKRINNILKKSGHTSENYDEALFEDDYERELAKLIADKADQINREVSEENFTMAMTQLLTFSAPVDNFFENVMVMAKDEKIRLNRLSLLNKLKSVFNMLGDLTKII